MLVVWTSSRGPEILLRMLPELFVVLLRWGRKDESEESPLPLTRRVVKARDSDIFAVRVNRRCRSGSLR